MVPLQIVSLLGTKTDGYSEFTYYPFRSERETVGKPTFQMWLAERYPGRFTVHEFPTVDAQGIQPDALEAVAACIVRLLADGGSVLLIDSAGAERTARVCEELGYVRL